MAGYTSRLFLTLSVPFFGFVLWFLKRKNSSKGANTSIGIEDLAAPSGSFEKQCGSEDSMKLTNQESCCETQSAAMQLRETQTPEPETANQIDCVQQNGVQDSDLQRDCIQQNVVQENDVQLEREQQNGLQENLLQQDCALKNGVQENALQWDCVLENGVQANALQQNCVQQNGVQHEEIVQNGTSKIKKNSTKMREKSNTCLSDIVNGHEMLQDNRCELASAIEAVDLNSVSSKDELLNVINKTQSDMEVNKCSNSNSQPIASNLSSQTIKSAKSCDRVLKESDETNFNQKKRSLQTDSRTDSRESLELPVDCTNGSQGDMLESPGATYCDSVGSTDSGRGGSEIHFESLPSHENNILNYAFEIPQRVVGLLIGRQGKNVNLIKEETNVDVLIKRHPTSNMNKICMLTGTEDEINAALRKIRNKFPPERFPAVTLTQICFLPFTQCPENLMLRLPEGSSFDVMLSATVTAGHFFLQQPTHPTFHSLIGLTCQMTESYNRDLTAPALPHMEKGYICAANLADCWYRAALEDVFYETDECRVRFLDYGGFSILQRSALRQINYQFMNVPFQATECYLGLIAPLEGQNEWSADATVAFEELAQGQILQGFIIAYADNGIPYVQLYRITGVDHIDINMELIKRGVVRCVKPEPSV